MIIHLLLCRELYYFFLFSHLSNAIMLQVNASIIATEADQVQKAIIELVNIHGIRKLVIGAEPNK